MNRSFAWACDLGPLYPYPYLIRINAAFYLNLVIMRSQVNPPSLVGCVPANVRAPHLSYVLGLAPTAYIITAFFADGASTNSDWGRED
jgi:hypothetical protein